MTRRLWLAVRILAVLGLVSLAFGTVVPTTGPASSPQSTPYFSTLSNMAVSTAEACPCNLKQCWQNTCIDNPNIENPTACCSHGGPTCQTILCFG